MCDMDRLAEWKAWVAWGRIGPEPSLSGIDLRCANLHGVDLQDADLRNANLRYANLSVADLRDADLYGANLRYANLYEAKLDGVLNAKELIVDDPRGCRLVVIRHDDGWHVFAGCRHFKTISEATDHWGHTDYFPNLDRGQRYVQALTNFAKEM